MPVPSRTMYAILGFLAMRPMSGYDIKKAVEQSVDNFWSESFGQIYPILKRLAAAGLVERTASRRGGERARHVYAITDAGRERLRCWLGEATEPPRVRNELLLKIFFGRQTNLDTNRRQIRSYRERLARDLNKYQAIAERLRRDYADNPDLPFWLTTLRYGERRHAALIAWCDEAVALLERSVTPKRRGARSARGTAKQRSTGG